jgi:drug/metabolite transporter (DMT)-like permease
MLVANLLFSFVDTSTKWLLGAGLAAFQLAFARYFVHFLITAVDTRRAGHRHEVLTGRQTVLVGLRAFCLVSATVANFFALGHLSLAVTSSLLFLSPVLVCLFSGVVLQERVTTAQWMFICIGFGGVLLVVQPFGVGINWYALLMLYPAAGMAFYSILTRKLAGQVSAARMQLVTGALGSVVLALPAIWVWQMPEGFVGWTLFLLIGAFAWAGHEAMTRAHFQADASLLMPFGYSFVIYLSVASWLVFNDVPDGLTLAGCLTVVLSGLGLWGVRHRSK